MTKTAERMDKLHTQIEALSAGIEKQQQGYAALIAAGDDEKADKLAATIRKEHDRLDILSDRVPALESLIEQEQDEARTIEGESLGKQADEKHVELVAQFKIIDGLAAELNEAIKDIPADMNSWVSVAQQAAALGANPNLSTVGDSGALLSMDGPVSQVRNALTSCMVLTSQFRR